MELTQATARVMLQLAGLDYEERGSTLYVEGYSIPANPFGAAWACGRLGRRTILCGHWERTAYDLGRAGLNPFDVPR